MAWWHLDPWILTIWWLIGYHAFDDVIIPPFKNGVVTTIWLWEPLLSLQKILLEGGLSLAFRNVKWAVMAHSSSGGIGRLPVCVLIRCSYTIALQIGLTFSVSFFTIPNCWKSTISPLGLIQLYFAVSSFKWNSNN